MIARRLLLSLALSLSALPTVAAPDRAQELVREHLRALGDLDSVQSRRVKLRAIGMAPFELPITVESRRPGLLRREVRIQDQVQITGFDGQQAWRIDPFVPGGQQEVPAAELPALREEVLFDGLLAAALRQKLPLRYLGESEVEGRKVHGLQVELPGSGESTVYLDAKTLLEVKRVQKRQDGVIESFSRDYRRVAGVQIPHLIEIGVPGATQRAQMRIESVELNPVLDTARFSRPNGGAR